MLIEKETGLIKTQLVSNIMTGYVYFIENGRGGPIKIGYSESNNIKKRLVELQPYNPALLTLMCFIKGTRELEAYYHKKFAKYNIRGEWFERNDELDKLISKQNYLGVISKSDSCFLDKSPVWKGADASYAAKRRRAMIYFPIGDKKCEMCGESGWCRKFRDGDFDNLQEENIMIVCGKCAAVVDGRVGPGTLPEKAKIYHQTLKNNKKPKYCIICGKQEKPYLSLNRCPNCYSYYRKYGHDKIVEVSGIKQERNY